MKLSASRLLLIVAAIIFALAAFGVADAGVELVAFGLMLLAIALAV